MLVVILMMLKKLYSLIKISLKILMNLIKEAKDAEEVADRRKKLKLLKSLFLKMIKF